MEAYVSYLLTRLTDLLDLLEEVRRIDDKRAESCMPARFSRGYLLGYAHALQAAYDALPEYMQEADAAPIDLKPTA